MEIPLTFLLNKNQVFLFVFFLDRSLSYQNLILDFDIITSVKKENKQKKPGTRKNKTESQLSALINQVKTIDYCFYLEFCYLHKFQFSQCFR